MGEALGKARTMKKVYMVWRNNNIVALCESHEGATAVVAREQGRIGGEWRRTGNRWLLVDRQAPDYCLEIDCREVLP